ncbi:MAG: NnrU family protein [Gammaproteobacteria bacterium]
MGHGYSLLGLSTAVFVTSHLALSSAPIRSATVRRLGETHFLILYSVISVIALSWMIMAYVKTPHDDFLWPPSPPLHTVPLFIMPFAAVLLVAGVTGKHPAGIQTRGAIDSSPNVNGILRITRHPVQWSIVLWSLSHIIANGDKSSVIFFGGFFLLAAVSSYLTDLKCKKQVGNKTNEFAEMTSNLPFAAIISGRNHLNIVEIGWPIIIVSALLYGAILILHPIIFRVTPY